MAPLTFTCPKCSKKMGVRPDSAGKAVRCPHCKEVIRAPQITVTPPVATAPASPPPPHVEPDLPLPDFSKGQSEGVESIFADPEDGGESVFGEFEVVRKLEVPPPEKVKEPEPSAPILPPAPLSGLNLSESVPSPWFPTPDPLPIPAQIQAPTVPSTEPTSTPVVGAYDYPITLPARPEEVWDDLPTLTENPEPLPDPVDPPTPLEQPIPAEIAAIAPQVRTPDPEPRRRTPLPKPSSSDKVKNLIILGLAIYSLIATVAAGWGWLREPAKPPTPAPKTTK